MDVLNIVVDFLKSLVKSVEKPFTIVTDGHPAHRAKFTQEYVAQEPKILGLHLLPGYSPELNPDEQAWNHLKEKLGKAALKTKEEFIDFIRSTMRSLQKSLRVSSGCMIPVMHADRVTYNLWRSIRYRQAYLSKIL